FGSMDAVVGPITLPKLALWHQAQEATLEFTEKLKAQSIDNYGQKGKLQPSPGQLLNIWHDALMLQRPDAQEVEAAFDQGQYEAAAKALQKALNVPAGGASLDEMQPLLEESVLSFAGQYPQAPQATEAAANLPPAEAPHIEVPPELGALEKKTLGQLLRDQALQNVLSFVALTVVGYLIFADKFVGTNGDLLSAFFWGFTTDIGLDALITAGKSRQGGA